MDETTTDLKQSNDCLKLTYRYESNWEKESRRVLVDLQSGTLEYDHKDPDTISPVKAVLGNLVARVVWPELLEWGGPVQAESHDMNCSYKKANVDGGTQTESCKPVYYNDDMHRRP